MRKLYLFIFVYTIGFFYTFSHCVFELNGTAEQLFLLVPEIFITSLLWIFYWFPTWVIGLVFVFLGYYYASTK